MFSRGAPSATQDMTTMQANDESNGVANDSYGASTSSPCRAQFNMNQLEQWRSLLAGSGRIEHVGNDEGNGQENPQKEGTVSSVSSLSTPAPKIRMAVVRYFLDRPGYDLRHSAARLWFHPPAVCTPQDIREFLNQQQISMKGLLVEIFLDKFDSFMMLDAIEAAFLEWDFSDTSPAQPATLKVRLTDLEQGQLAEGAMIAGSNKSEPSSSPTMASTSPVGLFAFSLVTGLETIALAHKLIPGSLEDSYILVWGPYGFFIGGLLQVFVGIFEVFRNNIYGAVAFLTFGCIWFSNGLSIILQTHFSGTDTPANEFLGEADPWFNFVRIAIIFAFCCALEVQTWTMNKLSSILVGILCVKLFFQSFAPWSLGAEWMEFILGWVLTCFAFYVFFVEFTNQVYQRTVFPMYKWSEEESPEEIFGAAGRSGTLTSKAARLRQANYARIQQGHLRELPAKEGAPAYKTKKSV